MHANENLDCLSKCGKCLFWIKVFQFSTDIGLDNFFNWFFFRKRFQYVPITTEVHSYILLLLLLLLGIYAFFEFNSNPFTKKLVYCAL